MNLQELRGAHSGEECFIIGTGPSLNETDLKQLTGRVTFGVNGMYKHPLDCTYFVVTDPKYWENHKTPILERVKQSRSVLFLGVDGEVGDEIIHLPISEKSMKECAGEEWDASKKVYRGITVIIACLQLAFYMDFKKVYLVGCDCHYDPNQHHFDNSVIYKPGGKLIDDWNPAFWQYRMCKKMFEKHGKNVYNSTVGGKLEVFTRVKLEDAVNESNHPNQDQLTTSTEQKSPTFL